MMKTDNPKKYRLVIILLIIVNLILISTWWYFDSTRLDMGDSNHHGRKEMRKNFFQTTLGLDSIQSEQFNMNNKEHFKRIRTMNNEIDSLKLLIRDEVFKPNPDEEVLNELFSKIAVIRTSIDTSIYYHFKELRSICKPSQVASFDSLMNEFFTKKERFSGRNRRGQDRK